VVTARLRRICHTLLMPPPPLPPVLSAAQCRVARALLQWSQKQLCEQVHVARTTLAAFEQGRHVPSRRTLARITRTFEDHGICFVWPSNGWEGVRLARPTDRARQNTVPPRTSDTNGT
jgi:DNA-binding XRE family transcriptional regulator